MLFFLKSLGNVHNLPYLSTPFKGRWRAKQRNRHLPIHWVWA